MRERGILSWAAVIGFTVVALLAPSMARAQTPATAGPPTPPAAGQPPPSGGFTGNATVGISLESGRTDLNGFQAAFQGRHPYSAAGALTMAFGYTRATTRPPGRPERFTVANHVDGTIGLEHNVGERYLVMLSSQALRDPIARIDYRFEQIGGFGVRVNGKRAQLRVVPGMALINQDKNIQKEQGFDVDYGIYQDARVAMTPAWTVTEFIYASRDVSDAKDYIISLNGSLTGAITRHLALQLSYQYSYESLLPVGVEPRYQKIMTGLQIRF